MLPGILNQLGPESLTHLKKLANNVTTQFKQNEDEDVPGQFGWELVGRKIWGHFKEILMIAAILLWIGQRSFSPKLA